MQIIAPEQRMWSAEKQDGNGCYGPWNLQWIVRLRESELTAHRSRTVTAAKAGSPTLDQDAVMVAWYPCLFHRTTALLLPVSGPAHTYKQSRQFQFQYHAKALPFCAVDQTSSW